MTSNDPGARNRAVDTLDLLDLDCENMHNVLAEWGQPSYRLQQVWNWLYVNLAADPDQMTNLPKDLRTRLARETIVGGLTPVAIQRSRDGETVKWLFELAALLSDRHSSVKAQVETVLMGYHSRFTACISTQAGCAMGCTFCATGQMGLQRNLRVGEIVAQALFVSRELAQLNAKLTNVVFMGMGEPLANYDATLSAVRRLCDHEGFNMSPRRITISTVGLVPAIERLSREGLPVGLAVSLHAATDQLRTTLVPINRRFPLDQVFAACRDYVAHTRRRISFEWALIADVNDSVEQAQILATQVKGMPCHVNLIPLNPTGDFSGTPSPPENIAAFRAELERRGIPNTVRVRRGIDIQAGCGQLRERTASAAWRQGKNLGI